VSRHRLLSRRSYRVWMGVNMTLLLALSCTVLYFTVGGGTTRGSAVAPDFLANPTASASVAASVPTKAEILSATGTYFGLSSPQAPWSRNEVNGLAGRAGARPDLLEYFVNWTEEFRPQAVVASYAQGCVPVISWEPWAGLQSGTSQPAYALARITGGAYDSYLTRFATAVRDQRFPVVIRLAHEMNGTWYPWDESLSGNQPGQYAPMWRHVHDIFSRVGATNVIWLWSPNIVRPVPDVALHPLYPGDAYVDWIGMVGYQATEETTAAETYDLTLKKIHSFTQKPVLITETGAAPGPNQAGWTADLFRWLAGRHDVLGFIWFEYDKADTGTKDWRFSTVPDTLHAFQQGMKRLTLATPVRG
jgi:hypothetical protein